MKKFPKRILSLNFEKDILEAEEKLKTKYGFLKDEINFIIKKKPAFILFEKEGDHEGLKMLYRYFTEERNY